MVCKLSTETFLQSRGMKTLKHRAEGPTYFQLGPTKEDIIFTAAVHETGVNFFAKRGQYGEEILVEIRYPTHLSVERVPDMIGAAFARSREDGMTDGQRSILDSYERLLGK